MRITERTARIILSSVGTLISAGLIGLLLIRSADPAKLMIWLMSALGAISLIWVVAWAIVSEYEARTPFEQDWPRGDAQREAKRPPACQLTDGVRPCCEIIDDLPDVLDAMHDALLRRADEATGTFAAVKDD